MQLHTIHPDSEPSLTVASVDSSYPSFSRAQNWGGVEFFQVVKLQLPQSSPDIRVAAQLSDGSPLLVDRQIGEGHVLVFASALDNIANNLPIQRSGCRLSIRPRTRWAEWARRPAITGSDLTWICEP